MVKLLHASVAKYSRPTGKVKDLAEDRSLLSTEVAASAVREEKLKEQLSAAKANLEASKEKVAALELEVEAARAREEELASVQGDVFRALTKRIFLNKKFSSLVAALTKPASTRAVAEVLDLVAADIPELEKRKYGYEVIPDEVMLRTYGRVLMKKTAKFPVVEALACQRTLLSAEEVRKCDIDRDVEFEALLGPMREELEDHPLSLDASDDEEGEEEKEEVETAAPVQKAVNAEVEKTAEVQQPPTGEEELSGGNNSETDLTIYLKEIKRLKILLDVKDGEIMRLDKRVEHIRNEYDVKYKALQVISDGNKARYLRKKDLLKVAKEKVEEHAEYEQVIHELGGATISEVETEALQVAKRVAREQHFRGPDSWEVTDIVAEMRRLTNLFPIIVARQPIIKEWLVAYPKVQPAATNIPRFRSLSPTVPSRLLCDLTELLSFPA